MWVHPSELIPVSPQLFPGVKRELSPRFGNGKSQGNNLSSFKRFISICFMYCQALKLCMVCNHRSNFPQNIKSRTKEILARAPMHSVSTFVVQSRFKTTIKNHYWQNSSATLKKLFPPINMQNMHEFLQESQLSNSIWLCFNPHKGICTLMKIQAWARWKIYIFQTKKV